jgi:F-type H+-transporting ATPase subunit gamma
MKAVAASSIGQYESAIRSLADYEHSVELGLSLCFRQKGFIAPSPVKRKPEGVVGAVVFGSDQGLVGKFNEMVVGFTEKILADEPGEKRIWAVGERVYGGLADTGLPMAGRFGVPTSVEGITSLVGQLQVAIEEKSEKAVAEVYVFHAHPTTGALYEVVQQRLLPLDAQWQKGLAKISWPTKNLPELFGHDEATLRAFVREYLFIVLFRACAESLASENASRLAAMQRAEKNIDSLSTELNRSFYRLRQNSIDEELFDVISGFNALYVKPSAHPQ